MIQFSFQPARHGLCAGIREFVQRVSVVCSITSSLLYHLINFSFMEKSQQYQTCIEACLRCASICNQCASACLQEQDVKMMVRCIQLDMECAAICYAAAQVMSIGGENAERLCGICADICQACGDECAKHKMEHCQRCAEACHHCAEECRSMAGVMA